MNVNEEITPLRQYCNIFGQTQIQTVALSHYMENKLATQPLNNILPQLNQLYTNYSDDDQPLWIIVKKMYWDGQLQRLNYMMPSHITAQGQTQFIMLPSKPTAPPLFPV